MASRETVVVTGASGGIGRAVVRRFAREGASVGLIGRNDTALECARREVEEGGGRALAVATDVSDAAASGRDRGRARPGRRLGQQRDDDRVTYLGAVWGTRTALRRMLPRDRGTIVQVGSALACRGIQLQPQPRVARALDDGAAARAEHAAVRHCRSKMPTRALKAVRETENLSKRLGRSPSVRGVARAVGCSSEGLLEAYEAASSYDTASLDAPAGRDSEDGAAVVDMVGRDDGGYEAVADGEALAAAWKELPARERRVLELRFVRGLTQREIGEAIGFSQMHVSRLLRRAIS